MALLGLFTELMYRYVFICQRISVISHGVMKFVTLIFLTFYEFPTTNRDVMNVRVSVCLYVGLWPRRSETNAIYFFTRVCIHSKKV